MALDQARHQESAAGIEPLGALGVSPSFRLQDSSGDVVFDRPFQKLIDDAEDVVPNLVANRTRRAV